MASAARTAWVGSQVKPTPYIACVDYDDDRPLSPFPSEDEIEEQVCTSLFKCSPIAHLVSRSIQLDQSRDSDNNNNTSSSALGLHHSLIVSLDLDDYACQSFSRFHSPEWLSPPSQLPAEDAPLDLKPAPVAAFTSSLVNNSSACIINSRDNPPSRRLIPIVNIDVDSPLPSFEDTELSSSTESVDPKLTPVIGPTLGTPLFHHSTLPKPATVTGNDHRPPCTIPQGPVIAEPSLYKPVSQEYSPMIPSQQERSVTWVHTLVFTPSFENVELPSPFPSPSVRGDRSIEETLAEQVNMEVDLLPPNIICSGPITLASFSDRVQGSSLATLDRSTRVDESLGNHATMEADLPHPRIISSQSATIASSDAAAPSLNGSAPIADERAATTSGPEYPTRLVTTTIFTPSLDHAELPSSFRSPSFHAASIQDQASTTDTRMEVDSDIPGLSSDEPVIAALSDDRPQCFNSPGLTLANSMTTPAEPRAATPFRRNHAARPLSTAIFTLSLEDGELSNLFLPPSFNKAGSGESSSTTDTTPPEHTSNEPIVPGLSVDEAGCSHDYSTNPALSAVICPDLSDNTSHNHTVPVIDIARGPGLPIITIEISDDSPLSPFRDSSSGLTPECPSPGRSLLSPCNADDEIVFLRQANSNLEAGFTRGEVASDAKGVAEGSTFRPHWKPRWEKFPLKEINHEQSEASATHLLHRCMDDVNADETNPDWLTSELLSQKFSLPV